jgi:diguanylate cyclase (GGDEF)-like protein
MTAIAEGAVGPPPQPRLRPITLPVVIFGAAVAEAAGLLFVGELPAAPAIAGVMALATAAIFVEAFPVPVEGIPSGGVSLAAVFIVGAAVLYGWQEAALVGFATRAAVELAQRRPAIRVAYNSGVYALSGAAAGAAAAASGDGSVGVIVGQALAASLAFYAVNVALVVAVVARSTGEPPVPLARRSIQLTIVPFSIMASLSLMLEVLWQRSPYLAVALIGPLVAVALYQRSVHRALEAVRLALTDPLTGLGNHRHFHESLRRSLADANALGVPLALCLVDVDNFKLVNDVYGHPVGDHVLSQVAARLRQSGESFRLGGDEFALLLPGRGEQDATAIAQALVDRIGAATYEQGTHMSVSAGVAVFPTQTVERRELLRLADTALYWAKEHGKNRVQLYRPEGVELTNLRRLPWSCDRVARLRAAATLAYAVDARDAHVGRHSTIVGDLAARIAGRLGLDTEQIELVRLAGSLHDLGKLAVPEEILRKPGPLDEAEKLVLQRHPQIGYRMLDSMGVDPVAAWVLHHHERWDGHGYPAGLTAEQIPLAARIVLVADAYDAMTSDRIYRRPLPHARAIAELERCAGTQFDPDAVNALREEFELAGDAGALSA